MPSLSEEEKVVVSGFVHKLLPLAAIATVCDQMDLKEENYVFVREGLKMLNKGAALPGMLILGEVLGISKTNSVLTLDLVSMLWNAWKMERLNLQLL